MNIIYTVYINIIKIKIYIYVNIHNKIYNKYKVYMYMLYT